MKYVVFASLLLATPALAQDGLKFDPAQLCAWQNANNSMDIGECVKLEDEAQSMLAELQSTADEARKTACAAEAQSFAADSGFASYSVYSGCLQNGPGNN